MRSSSVRPLGVVCAKKRWLTITWTIPRAALLSFPFECSADIPCDARCAFRRQRIAADKAPMLRSLGFADELAHADSALTPCSLAPVGFTSAGVIGFVLPTIFARPATTDSAGPMSPVVGCAPTGPVAPVFVAD